MKTSETVIKIYEALCAAQGELGGAKKNDKNPHFKNSFANLESVIEALKDPFKKNGLAFVQGIGEGQLITRFIHKSGEWIETYYPLVVRESNDPQKLAAAVTYAKRYALQAAAGLPSVDDDGNEEAGIDATPQASHVPNKAPEAKAKFTPPASVQARAAAAPKVQAPLFPKVVEGSSDLGSYIIKFGKHKDTMLSDMDIYALDGYLKYLQSQAAKDNKPLSGNAAELCEVGETYLRSRMHTDPGTVKWSNDEPPMPSDDDGPLPF